MAPPAGVAMAHIVELGLYKFVMCLNFYSFKSHAEMLLNFAVAKLVQTGYRTVLKNCFSKVMLRGSLTSR